MDHFADRTGLTLHVQVPTSLSLSLSLFLSALSPLCLSLCIRPLRSHSLSVAHFADRAGLTLHGQVHAYLTPSGFEVVLRKLIPTQIRQLILFISDSKGRVDGFVRDFADRAGLTLHVQVLLSTPL